MFNLVPAADCRPALRTGSCQPCNAVSVPGLVALLLPLLKPCISRPQCPCSGAAHHHSDHVGGNLALKTQFGATIVGPAADAGRIPGIDVQLKDGDRWAVKSSAVQGRHRPQLRLRGKGDCVHPRRRLCVPHMLFLAAAAAPAVPFAPHLPFVTAPSRYQLGAAEFVCYDTPGHTRGHVTFFFPASKALFPGRLFRSLVGCSAVVEHGIPAAGWRRVAWSLAWCIPCPAPPAAPGSARLHPSINLQPAPNRTAGDTLFSLGCGRLFEGTPAQMWSSLSKVGCAASF